MMDLKNLTSAALKELRRRIDDELELRPKWELVRVYKSEEMPGGTFDTFREAAERLAQLLGHGREYTIRRLY